MPTIADVIAAIERLAPPSLAADWDNIGLLLGDRNAAADRILTCLTLTPDVAKEAVAAGANLIITHHPILFRGAKRLTADTAEGNTVLTLAKAGIGVYSAHTAFDDCPGGINDQLAAIIGLVDIKPLRSTAVNDCKFVVFVPDADLARVSDAIFAEAAGVIGQYRECSYRLRGTGTFFGETTANPAVGKAGGREEVEEWRLEAVCPRHRLDAVVAAMRTAHSYEEPAFDVYLRINTNQGAGSGRIGELKQPQLLTDLATTLRTALKVGPIQLVGDPRKTVSRIAIACGAAGEFLTDAIRAGADAFVTGEMRFHDYLAAQAAGIALVLEGHYATERFAMEWLADWVKNQFPRVAVTPSIAERDPVVWI